MKVVIRNRFGTRSQAAILAELQLATSYRDSSLWNAHLLIWNMESLLLQTDMKTSEIVYIKAPIIVPSTQALQIKYSFLRETKASEASELFEECAPHHH